MTNSGRSVAVIGLGIMGSPMAANLIKAGYDVIGYNRSVAKTQALVERGGRAASTIAEGVGAADVVVTVLPDSPDVEEVAEGQDGLFDNAKPGTLWIDFSTIRPDVSKRLASAARARSIRALDAPVSGGEPGAIEGTLSIMVGGEAADFEAAKLGVGGRRFNYRARRSCGRWADG